MKRLIQILTAVLALCGVIAWTIFTAKVWQFGNSFKGMGDGAGGGDSGAGLLSLLLIGIVWVLPVSPYLCMAAGALNLIEGKLLRVAYVYSLIILAILTLIMLMSFQKKMEFMALGNFVVGGLWAFLFRGIFNAQIDESAVK